MGNTHPNQNPIVLRNENMCEFCLQNFFSNVQPPVKNKEGSNAKLCDNCILPGCARCNRQAKYYKYPKLFCEAHWNNGNPVTNHRL